MQGEAEVLVGSPYSLPHDAHKELARLQSTAGQVRADVRRASEEARNRGLLSQVVRDQQYREVYESNALEFEGPDLRGTIEALGTPLARSMEDATQAALLPQLLATDPDLHAVIGLEAARLFAARLLRALDERPLNETDIRSLHEFITKGHAFAGRYKRWHVQLGGHTEHEPVLPVEVPHHMHQLARWNSNCPQRDPVLHAAALHAWLTHIHPFEDGNGRVARLLANMTLMRVGLPPAIVKAKTQRNAYLDALATSDQGGDIMPLAGLFGKALQRYASDMQKPRFFRRLFADLAQNRGTQQVDWWSTELDIFLRLLAAELATLRLSTERWDAVDKEVFDAYRERRHFDPTTVLMVENDQGHQVAVQVGPPSRAITFDTVDSDMLPSVTFALRANRFELDAYRAAPDYILFGLREVYFELEAGSRSRVLHEGRISRGATSKIAEIAAGHIGRAFAAGRVSVRTPVRYRPRLSKLNGGPG